MYILYIYAIICNHENLPSGYHHTNMYIYIIYNIYIYIYINYIYIIYIYIIYICIIYIYNYIYI